MQFSNRNLTLGVPAAGSIPVRVTYRVTFTPFERHLAGLGLRFREEIAILESDLGEILLPPGGVAPTPDVLATFPNQLLPVTDGVTPLSIERARTMNVPLAILRSEDPPAMNPDEVQGRIVVRTIGFPMPTNTTFTDIENVP